VTPSEFREGAWCW